MTKQELLVETKELNQTRETLEKRLNELNQAKVDLDKVSNDFYNEIKNEKTKALNEIRKNVDSLIREKKNNLSPVTKTLVLKCDEYERKKAGFGIYLLLFLMFAGGFTALVVALGLTFTMAPVLRYILAIIVNLILSGVSVWAINIPKNKKINEIHQDPEASKYFDEIKAIQVQEFGKFRDIDNMQKETISKYNEQRDKDLKNIEKEIQKVQAERQKLAKRFLEIERQLFVIDNKNTIFIFGHNTYYDYEIYINGLLFSEEPARKLVKIKVNEGLTNIRVKSNHYENADNHTYYKAFSRECGVVQVESNETPVFLMLDGFDIQQLDMKEFFYRIENKKFKDN